MCTAGRAPRCAALHAAQRVTGRRSLRRHMVGAAHRDWPEACARPPPPVRVPCGANLRAGGGTHHIVLSSNLSGHLCGWGEGNCVASSLSPLREGRGGQAAARSGSAKVDGGAAVRAALRNLRFVRPDSSGRCGKRGQMQGHRSFDDCNRRLEARGKGDDKGIVLFLYSLDPTAARQVADANASHDSLG